MTRRQPPRLALALLERLVPDNAPLAGDLVEEFERRQSSAWFWWQVLAALVAAASDRPAEIRPLQLVDLQPLDALERTDRWRRQVRPVNLSASPLSGIGGLGLVVLACLVTVVVPGAWWALLASMLGGVVLGGLMIKIHARPSKGVTAIELHAVCLH
jgi:hypothetical protein